MTPAGKGLAIVALLVGGTPLAMAQGGPVTGWPGYPTTAQRGHVTGWPGYPTAKSHHAFKHYKSMYMQAKITHKHKDVKAAPAVSDTEKQ
jgi:hypothetical protein